MFETDVASSRPHFGPELKDLHRSDHSGAGVIALIPSGLNCSGLRIAQTSQAHNVPAIGKARWASLALKRLLDIIGALVGIILLSPLLAILSVAIVLADGGPVLFRQTREGMDGIPFPLLKFRTLRVDRCDWSGLEQVVANDNRLSPIGAFLRRTSLTNCRSY